jgi:polysaccharide pyruvyl transferase WcaK-like protein
MVRVTKKIGLLHHVGGGNHGDDASLDAVIHNIKSRWPEAEIFGFTMNPEDTQRRHGIPAYAIRQQTWNFGNSPVNDKVSFKQRAKTAVRKYRSVFWLLQTINTVAIRIPRTFFRELVFLAKSFRIIRPFHLLIICGGGQLVESSCGSWNFPYTVFKWVLLARLAGVRCFVLNVSTGPQIRPLSKYLVRGALFFADYVAFRDRESMALAHHSGLNGRAHVFPDTTYSLDVPTSDTYRIARPNGSIVGLAPMAYGDPRSSTEHERAVYDRFIRKLDAFGSWLVRNHHYLTLFCSDIGADPPVIEDLERTFKTHTNTTEANSIGSLGRVHQWTSAELFLNMSRMDYVVTCRFYGVVFAHMLNIPVLALSNHPKVKMLMNDLGLSKYCVDIRECDVNALTEAFTSLVSDRDEIKTLMAKRLGYYRSRLSIQFDELFPQDTNPLPNV